MKDYLTLGTVIVKFWCGDFELILLKMANCRYCLSEPEKSNGKYIPLYDLQIFSRSFSITNKTVPEDLFIEMQKWLTASEL
jgi:hypothetical protein